jgi:hypothetical protein
MKMTNKYAFLALLAAALVLTPLGRAQSWSTIGSTCQPGTDSLGLYTYGNGGTTFQFAPGETGTISARCQVNNPMDKGAPSWTNLGAGYVDPDGEGGDYEVQVRLVEANRATGNSTIVATYDSNTHGINVPTFKTTTFSHAFNFAKFAYYVTIVVRRSDDAGNPGVWYASLN